MSDYIKRADAIEVLQQFAEDEKPTDEMSKQFQQYQRGRHLAFLQAVEEIKALPSADAKGDLIRRADIQYHTQLEPMGNGQYSDVEVAYKDDIDALPSADAVQEAIPTVVRVTMSDGSQYYLEHERDAIHADAVQGEWQHTITWQPYCSNCEYVFGEDEEFSPFWKYCPMCGARMKGGAE